MVTGLEVDTDKEDAELLQVANYMNGGHYNPHTDYVMREKVPDHVSMTSLHSHIFLNACLLDDLHAREEPLHR